MNILWNYVIKTQYPYNLYFFWGIPSLFFHILICSYFSYKNIKKIQNNKIQKDYFPSLNHILNISIPQLIIFIFMMYLQLIYPITIELPKKVLTLKEHILEIFKLVIVGDFLLYWYHRLAHMNKWFRNNIHDVHHTYSAVFSWAGTYIHPIELICSTATQIIPHIIFSPHPLSIWIHMCIWTILLDEQHSGYNEWWSPWNLLPFEFGGGALPHNIHHIKQNYNYGFIFNIWDIIFSTYHKPYDKNGNICSNIYVPPYKLKFKTKNK